MRRTPEGLARIGDKLVLGACVLVSLWFLTLDDQTRIEKAAWWAHHLVTPIEWGSRVLEDVAGLQRENQDLKARLTALELDAQQIATERARIEELREKAGFFVRSRGALMPAEVIELVVSRFPVQCKIKTFGHDSLRVWQPVVTERGLVGRVRQVLDTDGALVQLLTDEDSRISIEVERTGVIGLLRFDGHQFQMDNVPRGEALDTGDRLITSGLGGTVPRGLHVGTVADIRSSAAELFQQISVEPGVRFTALSDVYVVVRPGPWYSLRGDTAHSESDSTLTASTDSTATSR